MDETRTANLNYPKSRRIAASSRPTQTSKLRLERQKLDKPRQARSTQSSEASHALQHNAVLAPIAVGALIVGFVLLLWFILGIVSWGFGNGCMAQC